MATKYFKKLNTANVMQDRTGAAIQWESVGDLDRTGVLALDESAKADLIADLEKYAADRVGGIIVISPEIYEELKKKEPEFRKSSALSSLRVARHQPPAANQEVVAPSAAVADAKAREVAPNASTFIARTRRLNAAKQQSTE